jgi:hypothetical protein
VEHGERIARSVGGAGWSDPARQFVTAFEKAMRTAL